MKKEWNRTDIWYKRCNIADKRIFTICIPNSSGYALFAIAAQKGSLKMMRADFERLFPMSYESWVDFQR